MGRPECRKLVLGVKDRCDVTLCEDAHAAPHVSKGKSTEFEVGDDAEVVASSAESPVEVWELGRASGHNDARGSDHVVAIDVVARPPAFVGEEGNAAAQYEPWHANGRHAAAHHADASLVEFAVNVHPSVSGSDIRCFLVLRQLDLLEGRH